MGGNHTRRRSRPMTPCSKPTLRMAGTSAILLCWWMWPDRWVFPQTKLRMHSGKGDTEPVSMLIGRNHENTA